MLARRQHGALCAARTAAVMQAHVARCAPDQLVRTNLRALAMASSKSIAIPQRDPMPSLQTFQARLKAYAHLGKARLSALVVMTTGAGFLMAGGPIAWPAFAAATIGTTLAAASANAFNQLREVTQDSKMLRTHKRPLPTATISRANALAFSAITATSSVAILAAGCNPLVATLGACNIGLYALVYTPMKMRSELNTWVGSVVGAIPPIMGWAAATGSALAPEAALQAALLFCWQMPHFFALSWRARKDYARGGFRMVACRDPTGARSGALALRYQLYMFAIPVAAALTDATSYMFTVEGTLVNAYATYVAYQFYRRPSNATAHKVFTCSLWFLPVMLGAMVLHSQHWFDEEERKEARRQKATVVDLLLGDDQAMEDEHHDAAVSEENAVSSYVTHSIRRARRSLREWCLHERMFGAKSRMQQAGLDASALCPVQVASAVKDTIAITTLATSKLREQQEETQAGARGEQWTSDE